MSRNLIVLSDGTGNSAAKAEKTNVWRVFDSLELAGDDQLARYDDGVGSSSVKLLALIGGVFGFGLKRNVLKLYLFLCRNHRPGDRIHGFGFSRGAFTIRVLVGLIAEVGLVPLGSEDDMERDAATAYRRYRARQFRSLSPIIWLGRLVRDGLLRVGRGDAWGLLARRIEAAHRSDVGIDFLGLWDTVDAYGLPIEELKLGIHRVLWPMLFGERTLSPKVRKACHALALDDERTSFHPVLWDEAAEAAMVAAGKVERGRMMQVWFAGVHANVGGGYPEDPLALVSLDWIMAHAARAGIAFHADCRERFAAGQSPYARLYDSRAGLAAYYRYGPRRVPVPTDPHGNDILPIVHHSVIRRMVAGPDHYAPISLPADFRVLYALDTLVSLQDVHACEPRFPPGADTAAIELAWNTVWWRRAAYFFTIAFTLLLLLYPFAAKDWTGGLENATRRIPIVGATLFEQWRFLGRVLAAPIGNAAELLSDVVPGYAKPWLRALTEHPTEFSVLVAGVGFGLFRGARLQTRLRDRARLAWHPDFHPIYEVAAKTHRASRRGTLQALAVAAGAALPASFFFPAATPAIRAELWIVFGVLCLFVVTPLLVDRIAQPAQGTVRQKFGTAALTVAEWVERRGFPGRLRSVHDLVFRQLTPLLFGVFAATVAALLFNRTLFDTAVSVGLICSTPDEGDAFPTSAMCWRYGSRDTVLEKGQRYRITLRTDGDWFDRDVRADVGGFTDWRHQLLTLAKRRWSGAWFQPVARIGIDGFDEYLLSPLKPFPEKAYRRCERGRLDSFWPIDRRITRDGANLCIDEQPTPCSRRILVADIVPRTSGPLFLYVNDAVVAWPGAAGFFYRNNSGTARVVVERLGPRGEDRPNDAAPSDAACPDASADPSVASPADRSPGSAARPPEDGRPAERVSPDSPARRSSPRPAAPAAPRSSAWRRARSSTARPTAPACR